MALRRQALLELQLRAEAPRRAGRERTDVAPQAECGRPAEAEFCAAGLAPGRPGSVPVAGPEPGRDVREVAGWRPAIGGSRTEVR